MAKDVKSPDWIHIPGNGWELYRNNSGHSQQFLWSYRQTYHLKSAKNKPNKTKKHASVANIDNVDKEVFVVENLHKSNVKFSKKVMTEIIIYLQITGNTMLLLRKIARFQIYPKFFQLKSSLKLCMLLFSFSSQGSLRKIVIFYFDSSNM